MISHFPIKASVLYMWVKHVRDVFTPSAGSQIVPSKKESVKDPESFDPKMSSDWKQAAKNNEANR